MSNSRNDMPLYGFTESDMASRDAGYDVVDGEEKKLSKEEMDKHNRYMEDMMWLDMATKANENSKSFFDSSIRVKVERAIAHFHGRHAQGSKYHSDAYRFRSKLFDPRTRSAVRRHEAAAAMAYFATADAVSITPDNESDEKAVASAKINDELVNLRLDRSIPWFMTLVGAYQETHVTGVVISRTNWLYEAVEVDEDVKLVDSQGNPIPGNDGQPATVKRPVKKVLNDKPEVTLIPLENIRIDKAANWIDPVNTSPYIIEYIPMYIYEIKEKMESGEWRYYDDGMLKTGNNSSDYDSIRMAREGDEREDPMEGDSDIYDYSLVWVHQNIMIKDGQDYVFYTLGTSLLLSDPEPIEEVFRHCTTKDRPYQMGICNIEAFRQYPSSTATEIDQLQVHANNSINDRRDNIALALARRYIIRRGANINTRLLTRVIPGGVVPTDDIQRDIKSESMPDVTSSAYQEQDRLNLSIDELSGVMSSSSVQGNRALNETVGGMNILTNDANSMTEYKLKVFSYTWVQKVLRSLVKLEQAYETDAVILRLAADKAKLYERYGIDEVTDDLLRQSITTRVDVGFGATSPEKRVEKVILGVRTVAEFFPHLLQGASEAEMVSEIFGALGYDDGKRFFPALDEEQEDPRVAQLEQQIQQMQQYIELKQAEQEVKLKIEEMRMQGKTEDRESRQQETLAKIKADIYKHEQQLMAQRESDLSGMKKDLSGKAMDISAKKEQFANEVALKRTGGPYGNWGLEGPN